MMKSQKLMEFLYYHLEIQLRHFWKIIRPLDNINYLLGIMVKITHVC